MVQFYKVKIADIYKETKDCAVVTLDIPIEIQPAFQFKQGQYLTFKTQLNNQEVRRSYSICSTPFEQKWQVAVKKIPGGLFSTYINENVQPGEEVEVMVPDGKFYIETQKNAAKNYIAFAAGSGITPMLSIIKTHLASEPHSTFKLFYLNRSVKSIIFKEEIEQLKNTYFNRFEIFHFLTKEHRPAELFNGRFTQEKIKTLTEKIIDIPNTHDCFLCGPEAMIQLLRDELTAAGLPKEYIHYELFTSGISEADKERSGQKRKSHYQSIEQERIK